MMTKVEIDEKIKSLLGDAPERAIIAECVYKGEAFRAFSITVSDSKDDGIDIPYAPFTELDKTEQFITLLQRRRSSELSDAVRTLLLTIKESLAKVGLDFKDEDIESLVGLEKPVIMVSRSK